MRGCPGGIQVHLDALPHSGRLPEEAARRLNGALGEAADSARETLCARRTRVSWSRPAPPSPMPTSRPAGKSCCSKRPRPVGVQWDLLGPENVLATLPHQNPLSRAGWGGRGWRGGGPLLPAPLWWAARLGQPSHALVCPGPVPAVGPSDISGLLTWGPQHSPRGLRLRHMEMHSLEQTDDRLFRK